MTCSGNVSGKQSTSKEVKGSGTGLGIIDWHMEEKPLERDETAKCITTPGRDYGGTLLPPYVTCNSKEE